MNDCKEMGTKTCAKTMLENHLCIGNRYTPLEKGLIFTSLFLSDDSYRYTLLIIFHKIYYFEPFNVCLTLKCVESDFKFHNTIHKFKWIVCIKKNLVLNANIKDYIQNLLQKKLTKHL